LANAVAVKAQPPSERKPGWPAVKEQKKAHPPAKSSTYLVQYMISTLFGLGFTWEAQVRASRRIRSG